jgi:hypothetical protein
MSYPRRSERAIQQSAYGDPQEETHFLHLFCDASSEGGPSSNDGRKRWAAMGHPQRRRLRPTWCLLGYLARGGALRPTPRGRWHLTLWRAIEGQPWPEVFEDYDVLAGRIWILVPLWTLVS